MDVTKIVINRVYGGFDLSDEAYSFIAKKKGWQHACNDYDRSYFITDNNDCMYALDLNRDDLDLVQCLETLGHAADGNYSELKIVEVPSDVSWVICEYDGIEWIAEQHRTWQ
jgi:hypothetical protein